MTPAQIKEVLDLLFGLMLVAVGFWAGWTLAIDYARKTMRETVAEYVKGGRS